MPVLSGVNVVIAVGGRACADVDLDVTAVGGRAGGGADVAVRSGLNGAATDVGARAGGGVDVNVSTVGGRAGGGVDINARTVGGRAGGGVDVNVSTVGGRAGGVVDVNVSTVGGRAGGGVDVNVSTVRGRTGDSADDGVDVEVSAVGGRADGDVTAVGGSAGVAVISDVDVTAVGGRAGGGVGAAVSSDVSFVVSCTAIVVEVDVVCCAPMEQRHGSTDYSRRGSVAGVDAFRVINCWQRRGREGGLVLGFLLREPSSGYSSNCDEASYIQGPKSFAQYVLGILAQFGEHCLRLAESRELSCGGGRNKYKNV